MSTKSDEPVWVVNDIGELGVEVNGRVFFLYKGGNIEYSKDVDSSPMKYRPVWKREFGEVCRPEKWWPLCHTCQRARCNWPDKYTPGDGWKTLER